MKISVVIPTFNSERTIGECLRSLREQSIPPFEIIVVDGKSTDSTTKIVNDFKKVKLLTNEQRDTPGSGRNRGAKTATGDIVFFCDSDCIEDQRALEYHTRAYGARDDIVGIMGSIRRTGIRTRVSVYIQRQIMASEWIENLNQDGTLKRHLNSANFSMVKKVFLEKRFREDITSAEDIELFIRLKKDRLKIFYEPRAVAYHHHPVTIEQLFKKSKWYGEGIFQVDKIHGKDFRDRYQIFSPVRYIDFSKDYLHSAVFFNNKLLCLGCGCDAIQKCRIRKPKLMKEKIDSDVDFHRVGCLAIAAGILKQRAGLDYQWR